MEAVAKWEKGIEKLYKKISENFNLETWKFK